MGLRIGALVVGCHDPGRLARFWAAALGWVISRDEWLQRYEAYQPARD